MPPVSKQSMLSNVFIKELERLWGQAWSVPFAHLMAGPSRLRMPVILLAA